MRHDRRPSDHAYGAATVEGCRGRRRGWITASTSVAELSVSTGANAPARTLTFRWRNSDDDLRDAETAEPERLRDEDKTIEHDASPEALNKD
jgi:hypothetical protein